MRLLRVRAEGLALYKEPFDVSIYAQQRIQTGHLNALHNLFGNIYVNTVNAFIGINASGKTTALRVISFASQLLCASPLEASPFFRILKDDQVATFDIDFFVCNKICHLQSEVIRKKKDNGKYSIEILSERLWSKNISSKINKSNLLDYEDRPPVRIRDDSDEYLSNDVSIMIAVNKQIHEPDIYVDLSQLTDINRFIFDVDSVPAEIISILDPTIEYIVLDRNNTNLLIRLKFYGEDEKVLINPNELNTYLSSGTIKGVRVFLHATNVLKGGGYLVIDEIENHFNRELGATLIRLFMDKRTNPKGAVIIFSTHYPELLDELERNDEVFITRSDTGLKVDNLNKLLNRNDMNRSEIYQSDYIRGTAPKYTALLALQKSLMKNIGD